MFAFTGRATAITVCYHTFFNTCFYVFVIDEKSKKEQHQEKIPEEAEKALPYTLDPRKKARVREATPNRGRESAPNKSISC